MYEAYYGKLQPYFGEKIIQNYHVDTDAIPLSIILKDIIKDLKNLEELFDFSKLNENHEFLVLKTKKLLGNLR